MATISLPYVLTDGNKLDTDQFNRNMFGFAADKCLYSEPNGKIEVANLDAAFTVQAPHVIPGEAVRVENEGAADTIDFVEDALTSDATEAKYFLIPGTGNRFYLPYDCVCLIEWNTFASNWRSFTGDITQQDPVDSAPAIYTKCFIDDSPINATRNLLPETIFLLTPAADGKLDHREARLTQKISYTWLTSLTAGWHSADLRLYMKPQGSVNDLYWCDEIVWTIASGDPPSAAPTAIIGETKMNHRVTFGHRGTTVLALMAM